MENVTCTKCGNLAIKVKGDYIYKNRPDLYHITIWLCQSCEARVGCYPKSDIPRGNFADAEDRKYRMMAHAHFDEIWKTGIMCRSEAYAWLSLEMELSSKMCHISSMDASQCKKVIEVVERYLKPLPLRG